MKQEDKELLLQDLCARLPYGVHCCVLNLNKTIKEDNDIIYGILGDNIVTLKSDKNECYMHYQVKPYLRPMSSMTKEEIKECYQLQKDTINITFDEYDEEWEKAIDLPYFKSLVDFYNSHHLDYCGLIEKGLALEASEEMYT